jgi:hypothetical protein
MKPIFMLIAFLCCQSNAQEAPAIHSTFPMLVSTADNFAKKIAIQSWILNCVAKTDQKQLKGCTLHISDLACGKDSFFTTEKDLPREGKFNYPNDWMSHGHLKFGQEGDDPLNCEFTFDKSGIVLSGECSQADMKMAMPDHEIELATFCKETRLRAKINSKATEGNHKKGLPN